MAKHLYSPDLSSMWSSLQEYLFEEGETNMPTSFAKVLAMLTERDRTLEGVLLGDLVVNDVAGTAGTITPPSDDQISWSMNVGAVSGTTDANGFLPVLYSQPFLTDTVVPLYFSSVQTEVNFLGFQAQIVVGSVSKTGFTIVDASTTSIAGGYVAIGF